MTVAVAHRNGWMVADTLTTQGGMFTAPWECHKILNFGHSMVVFAGNATVLYKAEKALKGTKTAEKFMDRLQAFCGESGQGNECMMINKDGLLACFDEGCFFPLGPDEQWYAIGSGSTHTLGWLGAVQAIKGQVTPEDVAEAVQFTLKYNITINGELDVAYLKGKATRR